MLTLLSEDGSGSQSFCLACKWSQFVWIPRQDLLSEEWSVLNQSRKYKSWDWIKVYHIIFYIISKYLDIYGLCLPLLYTKGCLCIKDNNYSMSIACDYVIILWLGLAILNFQHFKTNEHFLNVNYFTMKWIFLKKWCLSAENGFYLPLMLAKIWNILSLILGTKIIPSIFLDHSNLIMPWWSVISGTIF